jgi:hypothetical protein
LKGLDVCAGALLLASLSRRRNVKEGRKEGRKVMKLLLAMQGTVAMKDGKQEGRR